MPHPAPSLFEGQIIRNRHPGHSATSISPPPPPPGGGGGGGGAGGGGGGGGGGVGGGGLAPEIVAALVAGHYNLQGQHRVNMGGLHRGARGTNFSLPCLRAGRGRPADPGLRALASCPAVDPWRATRAGKKRPPPLKTFEPYCALGPSITVLVAMSVTAE